MSMIEQLTALRQQLVNDYVAQTGNVVCHGATLTDLLWECADEQIPEFAQLSDPEQEFVITDVCPENAEFRAQPVEVA